MKTIMVKSTLIFSILISSWFGFSQSFKDVKEIISISIKDPIDLESILIGKGFSFSGKKLERYKFTRSSESVSYELLPRVFQYSFYDRYYYLSFYSELKKAGFTISNSQVELIDSKGSKPATLFVKKGMKVYLVDFTNGTDHEYSILIYPGSNLDGGNMSSINKDDISFVNFNISLLSPKGVAAQNPSENTTYQQDFNGDSGIGAKRAYGLGISGVSGLNAINRKLPHFLDFGISLGATFNIQPFSYESLGAPFDDFKYGSFMRLGFGGGPAIVLSPIQNVDFRLIFYYDFTPSVNFGGSLEYENTQYDYEESVVRDDISYALARAYGVSVKYNNVIFSVQKSTYYDRADYTLSYGYNGVLTKNKFKSNLFFEHLSFKLGIAF
jgi:hypothetical protein